MTVGFLREFVRHPTTIGAIAPSSRWLARAMIGDAIMSAASVVVEIGSGTGAFTGEILANLRPGARFIAVEYNPAMATVIRERFPTVELHETSAVHLPDILRAAGCGSADCIISGLPWASFEEPLQNALLDAVHASLADGGRFATFAYLQGLLLPAGRRFRGKLNSAFSSVARSETVWRNLPPAFVYRCRK